jgi:IS4 transposase
MLSPTYNHLFMFVSKKKELITLKNNILKSMAVFDMGFTDYKWYQALMDSGIYFVTRLKSNARIQYLHKRAGRKAEGITFDRTILLGNISKALRMVCYRDPDTGKELTFVTNADDLDAKTIAQLYKERWQIELFFKWIKGNLKIKTFLGTSRNAVCSHKSGLP